MYCMPFSFKDPFDTKDMRSTGGGDARYDIDFPPRDHTLVAQLRSKGAIIYAKAVHDRVQRRAPAIPAARNTPDQGAAVGRRATSAARGAATRAIRTTHARGLARVELGLGVSVSANLVDVQHLRGDGRLVPRPGQPQLGGADPAAQGLISFSAARSAPTSTTIAPASTAARSPTPRRCSTR